MQLALIVPECQDVELPWSSFTRTQWENAMHFTPLHDRVLVRRIEDEKKTKGGLIVPDTAKEKPSEGSHLCWGGRTHGAGELIPMAVKAGDRILFGKWSGSEVRIEGEDLLIMKESDILGIIQGDAAAQKAA